MVSNNHSLRSATTSLSGTPAVSPSVASPPAFSHPEASTPAVSSGASSHSQPLLSRSECEAIAILVSRHASQIGDLSCQRHRLLLRFSRQFKKFEILFKMNIQIFSIILPPSSADPGHPSTARLRCQSTNAILPLWNDHFSNSLSSHDATAMVLLGPTTRMNGFTFNNI